VELKDFEQKHQNLIKRAREIVDKQIEGTEFTDVIIDIDHTIEKGIVIHAFIMRENGVNNLHITNGTHKYSLDDLADEDYEGFEEYVKDSIEQDKKPYAA